MAAAKALVTLLLAVVGSGVFGWGLRAIANRDTALRPFEGTAKGPSLRTFLRLWTALTLCAGASLVAGAVMLWLDGRLAAALILWPLAVAAAAIALARRRDRE